MSWYRGLFCYALSSKKFKDLSDDLDDSKTIDHFSSLFPENQSRVVFPFHSELELQVKSKLEGKGYKVDLDNSVAYRNIINNQGQEKTVGYRLGKTIQRELGADMLDKWSNGGSGISVVVSRNPIDILRMSDFKNIQSCHSEGGSYWKCAIQEAKNGGAVAFLVKTSDLKNIDLSAKEIFEDKDRKVNGIVPMSRLRLRRFVKKDESYDLAIPEIRSYGSRIDGFYEAVRNWAFDKQQKVLKGERPKMADFNRTGGSYQDSNPHNLFNGFFQDELDSGGSVKLIDNDEGEDMAEQWEAEIAEFDDAYPLERVWAAASVEGEEDYVYIYASAGVSFKIHEEWKTKLYDTISYKDQRQIRDEMSDIEGMPRSIEEIDLTDDAIRINFNNEGIDNPDDYRWLREEMGDLDSKYDAVYLKVLMVLAHFGLINLPQQFSHYEDLINEKTNLNLKNFHYDIKNGVIEIDSGVFVLGENSATITVQAAEQFKVRLSQIIKDTVQRVESSQLNLFNLPPLDISKMYNPVVSILPMNINIETGDGQVGFNFKVNIPFGSQEQLNATFLVISYLDNNFGFFINTAKKVFQEVMKEFPAILPPKQSKNLYSIRI